MRHVTSRSRTPGPIGTSSRTQRALETTQAARRTTTTKAKTKTKQKTLKQVMVVTCALMQTLDLLCLQEVLPTLAKISVKCLRHLQSPRLVASSEPSRSRAWRKRKANESHEIETTLKTLENRGRPRRLPNPSQPPASKQTNKQTNTFVSIKNKQTPKKSHPIKVIKWISVVLLPTWTPPPTKKNIYKFYKVHWSLRSGSGCYCFMYTSDWTPWSNIVCKILDSF